MTWDGCERTDLELIRSQFEHGEEFSTNMLIELMKENDYIVSQVVTELQRRQMPTQIGRTARRRIVPTNFASHFVHDLRIAAPHNGLPSIPADDRGMLRRIIPIQWNED